MLYHTIMLHIILLQALVFNNSMTTIVRIARVKLWPDFACRDICVIVASSLLYRVPAASKRLKIIGSAAVAINLYKLIAVIIVKIVLP